MVEKKKKNIYIYIYKEAGNSKSSYTKRSKLMVTGLEVTARASQKRKSLAASMHHVSNTKFHSHWRQTKKLKYK